MEIGSQIFLDPIPPVAENTTWFDAGGLSIGVEYRVLNDELLRQAYADDSVGVGIDDSGVSLHVNGPDGAEYLRFDCFKDEPHYHYVLPGCEYQRWVPYDATANGPMLEWALDCLRRRLADMLRASGGEALADAYDHGLATQALLDVEAAARAVMAPPKEP